MFGFFYYEIYQNLHNFNHMVLIEGVK